jgi:hypothetical protein
LESISPLDDLSTAEISRGADVATEVCVEIAVVAPIFKPDSHRPNPHFGSRHFRIRLAHALCDKSEVHPMRGLSHLHENA